MEKFLSQILLLFFTFYDEKKFRFTNHKAIVDKKESFQTEELLLLFRRARMSKPDKNVLSSPIHKFLSHPRVSLSQ